MRSSMSLNHNEEFNPVAQHPRISNTDLALAGCGVSDSCRRCRFAAGKRIPGYPQFEVTTLSGSLVRNKREKSIEKHAYM